MKTSTNALTARYCASVGRPCETVQSWRGRQRHDLFGIADSLMLSEGIVLFVQNCSYGTLKSHRDAISVHPMLPVLTAYGRVELWEWRRMKLKRGGKNKGREWYLRTQGFERGAWTEPSAWVGPFDLYPKKL